MSDEAAAGLSTWQQLGAFAGTALAGLGLGRASKREQTERVVEAIQKLEHTMDTRLGDLRTDIKVLLERVAR